MRAEVVNSHGLPCVPYVYMYRYARARLVTPDIKDLDTVNAHPTVLEQDMRAANIDCPKLRHYVVEREDCLQDVMDATGVDRRAAKQLFTRIMYLGGIRGWAEEHGVDFDSVPSFATELKAELKSTAKLFVNDSGMVPPDILTAGNDDDDDEEGVDGEDEVKRLHDHRPRDDPHRILASSLAKYLQTRERQIIEVLIRAVGQTSGYSVESIIHDGVHIRTKWEGEIPAKTIYGWECAVRQALGLRVQFEVKEFELPSDWVGPENYVEEFGDCPECPADYETTKALFEKTACKVVLDGLFVVEGRGQDIRMKSKDDLKASFEHVKYVKLEESKKRRDAGDDEAEQHVQYKDHTFVTDWLQDKYMRTYNRIDFLPPPAAAPEDTFNMWRGFAMEKYISTVAETRELDAGSPGVISLSEFVRTLLGSRALAEYFFDWAAQLVQQPGRKSEVAIVLKGKEGAGKNFLTRLLECIVGKSLTLRTADPTNTIFAKFNDARANKLLAIIDEAAGKDFFANDDKLKDIITAEDFYVESKGLKQYKSSCFVRLVITSNNVNPIKVTSGSRRYCVIKVSDELIGDYAYFKKLSDILDDQHVCAEFFAFLKQRDISKVDLRETRPITDEFLRLASLNLPLEHQFLKAKMLGWMNGASPWKPTSEKLWEEFRDWLTRSRIGKQPDKTQMQFNQSIAALVCEPIQLAGKSPMDGVKKHKSHGVWVYTFEKDRMIADMRRQRWITDTEFAESLEVSP